MASGSGDPTRPIFSTIVADPSAGGEHVSELLSLLDADERTTRLQAAWALCLVAHHDTETVGRISRGVADRLGVDDGQPPIEIELAFAYLRHRFQETVTQTLSEVAKESAIEDVRSRAQERAGGFARSNYISGGGMATRDVGRTKVPEGNDSDPRNVYQNRANEGEKPDEPKAFSELLADRIDDPDESRQVAAERHRERAVLEGAALDAHLEDVTAESEFDRLTIVAPGIEGRFTTIYRTRAHRGSTEEGVAINLFRQPDDDHEQFAADLSAQLENWAAIADEDAVLSVHDWATTPRPWTITDYTTRTLYDRLDMSLSVALRDALEIAKTVSYAHQRGVVHAGLDPYNVVYADGFMADRSRPLVKNFGLIEAMRQYFEPSTLLDPRYAAPEYYDTAYGDIDNATDVYQLGAVIYKLVTGRPPFEGQYNDVRNGVLNAQPVAPSDLNPEIPDGLDAVVRKSMAKGKLTRYETVTQLVADLRRTIDD